MTARPSIVVVLCDTLRADCAPSAAPSPHLSSLGLQRPDVPNLTALVQGSVRFTQAIACAPYTSACHGSLFTGLLPPETGVRTFTTASMHPEVRTLASILRDEGYETCAMSDQPRVLQVADLLRGFKTVVTNEDDALAWWDSYAASPRLLFFHLWDLHKPYGMPLTAEGRAAYPGIADQWRERLQAANIPLPDLNVYLDPDEQRTAVYHMQNSWELKHGFKAGLELYLDGLRQFDQGRLARLGTALRERAIPEQAILVVTADHGEGRDAPPSPRLCHGSTLRDDQIRIPLFIKAPDLPAATIDTQISQADIAPTLLDMLGLESKRTAPRTAWSGRSLLPLLHGKTLAPRPVYAEFWSLPANDPKSMYNYPLLRFRILRYPERKYELLGQHLSLEEAIQYPPDNVLLHRLQSRLQRVQQTWPRTVPEDLRHAPKDVFLRTLYESMRARHLTDADLAAWRHLPEDLSDSARLTVIKRFEDGPEAKVRVKYAIFDLQDDPLEEHPVDASRSRSQQGSYRQHLTMILQIAAVAREGGPLITAASDSQTIEEHLRDLGYVE